MPSLENELENVAIRILKADKTPIGTIVIPMKGRTEEVLALIRGTPLDDTYPQNDLHALLDGKVLFLYAQDVLSPPAKE